MASDERAKCERFVAAGMADEPAPVTWRRLASLLGDAERLSRAEALLREAFAESRVTDNVYLGECYFCGASLDDCASHFKDCLADRIDAFLAGGGAGAGGDGEMPRCAKCGAPGRYHDCREPST